MNRKNSILLLLIVTIVGVVQSQNNVGIGTLEPNSNALVDMHSDSKGLLLPRTSTSILQQLQLTETEAGLLFFDQTTKSFTYWDGSSWLPIGSSAQSPQSLTYDPVHQTLSISNGNAVSIGDLKGEKGDPGLVWRNNWSADTAYEASDVVFYNHQSYIASEPLIGINPEEHGWSILAERGAIGIEWKGDWTANEAYQPNDLVFYDGTTYIATANSENENPTKEQYWTVLAAQGAKGADGQNGADATSGGGNSIHTATGNTDQSTFSDEWSPVQGLSLTVTPQQSKGLVNFTASGMGHTLPYQSDRIKRVFFRLVVNGTPVAGTNEVVGEEELTSFWSAALNYPIQLNANQTNTVAMEWKRTGISVSDGDGVAIFQATDPSANHCALSITEHE